MSSDRLRRSSERSGGGVIVAPGRHTEDREDLVASDHHANIVRSALDLLAVIALDQQFAKISTRGHVLWSKQDCAYMVR